MAVPTGGLIAYWALEEVSGTRFDASGNGLDLTEVGSVGSATGIVSLAAESPDSGAGNYLQHLPTGTPLSPGDTDFTIACWVNIDETGNVEFVSKGMDSSSTGEYVIRKFSSDEIEFGVRDTSAVASQVSATTFGIAPLNTWIFIVAWHDSVNDTLNIQINDGPVDSASHTTGIQQTTFPLRLFRGRFSSGYKGLIDEVGIWDRVLTAGERTSLYNGGAGSTFVPLVSVEQTIDSNTTLDDGIDETDFISIILPFKLSTDDAEGTVIATQTTPVAPTLSTTTDLLTGDKVRLVWTGGGPFYNVYFKKTADVTFIKANQTKLSGSQTQYDVGGLDRNVSYDFQVSSINGVGVETF